MGKAERNRRQSAQQKIAAQQAAARRAENRRRGFIAGGSIVLVIAVVVTFIAVKAATSPATAGSTAVAGTAQPASVLNQVANVPAATLTSVGTGSTYQSAIQTVKGNPATLTKNGKAVIDYVGGEYCPYCAAERWALTSALSRFGKFSHLGFIHSSSTDVDPSTPTLTFYKSSYASKYVDFESTEARNDTNTANLEPLTALDKQLMAKYDVPPYVPSASDNDSFPFVDFANKYVIDGASYDPAVLKGLTWAQVAAALKDPSSPVAKGVDGAANLITAAICKATNGQPGNVCAATAVTQASGSI
jgi:thiol-disulfide isomerase/thioredoxin